jgi:putative salt-induced outer membrane protein YdiY
MNKLFFFFLITILTTNSFAILNIEKLRSDANNGFNSNLNLNLSGQKGNSNTSIINLKTLSSYYQSINQYLLITDYSYGESEGLTSVHRGSAHLRYSYANNVFFTKEVFTQSEFDKFRDLDFRQLFGLGLRTSLKKVTESKLYLGYGFFYEFEKYSTSADEKRIRFNSYLSYYNDIADNINISFILYVQPEVGDFSDTRVIFSPIVKSQINKKISMSSSIDYRLDTKPVNNNKKYDLSYNMGLIYNL